MTPEKRKALTSLYHSVEMVCGGSQLWVDLLKACEADEKAHRRTGGPMAETVKVTVMFLACDYVLHHRECPKSWRVFSAFREALVLGQALREACPTVAELDPRWPGLGISYAGDIAA